MTNHFSYIGSSGELETYKDDFGNVTPELIAEAEQVEARIVQQKGEIEAGYLRIARDLSDFRNKNLFLARGYTTFRQWADSPDIGIGYRLAHDLIRLADEAIPILAKHNALDAISSVSNMRELLPILADEGAEEKLVEAAFKVKDLTNREAKAAVKEIRGIEQKYDDKQPAVFFAQVRRGESAHQVTVHCGDGTDYYKVGVLTIKLRDWPRWEDRFGRFVEYTE